MLLVTPRQGHEHSQDLVCCIRGEDSERYAVERDTVRCYRETSGVVYCRDFRFEHI